MVTWGLCSFCNKENYLSQKVEMIQKSKFSWFCKEKFLLLLTSDSTAWQRTFPGLDFNAGWNEGLRTNQHLDVLLVQVQGLCQVIQPLPYQHGITFPSLFSRSFQSLVPVWFCSASCDFWSYFRCQYLVFAVLDFSLWAHSLENDS